MEDRRGGHLPHLGPSYGMDFDRHDYSNPYLPALPMGNGGGSASGGMNDISALAAAASDQLYELERHEAFRRAEYELRHRQIAAGAGRKSNGGSPGNATPSNVGGGGAAYGFSSERDRFNQAPSSGTTASGGQIVFPVSAPQPATANHPAVPAGTLADPTYLVPPTCCHEDCHKSYRKRLKVARQTAACPNCLGGSHGNGGHNGHSAGGAPHGGSGNNDGHHSSNSSTPKDRSNVGSSEDLTKLGGSSGQGNSYHLHHANLQQQLARLQQQHQSKQTSSSQPSSNSGSRSHHHKSTSRHHQLNPYPVNMHSHRSSHASLAPSADVSRAASPETDDSSDEEGGHSSHHVGSAPEFAQTSPVLAGMRGMSLFAGRNAATAPVSAVVSPVGSRATSPVDGHSASSGRHGHGSHTARDAKNRSHPYGTHHHHHVHHHPGSHSSMPSSPHVHATKSRMSPPKLPEPPHKSVEEILNSSAIPPPPPASDRMLPLPNSSASFSSVPSVSYSLSAGSAHGSPVGSRSSSPVHSTSHSTHSQIAHSVRAAFGMTPMFRGSDTTASSSNPSPKSVINNNQSSSSPNNRLPPLGVRNQDSKPSLPSFSRGPSPVHLMELDGQA